MKYIIPLYLILAVVGVYAEVYAEVHAGVHAGVHAKTEHVEDSCHANLETTCNNAGVVPVCNAKFGGININVTNQLNDYMCEHIGLSYKNLRLATNFNSYMKHRGGLNKLFKELSDESWENAINLVKYITKRGGQVDITECYTKWTDILAKNPEKEFSRTEIGSLTTALDWYKTLAKDAFKIHRHASDAHSHEHYDPEISSYIEENFAHAYAKTVRRLTGHVNDLTGLINSRDAKLGVYLFDENLKELS